MASDKKPVGRTPICSPQQLNRIDPLWCPGPVPFRFWLESAHRRDYLRWLGHRLRFRYMQDWYRLTSGHLAQNYGQGLAHTYWRSSPIEGVKECFPEYDWKEWLFAHVPVGFWDSRSNCRGYLDWLADRLGYRRLDDWYGVTTGDFERYRGRTLLIRYHGSPALVVMDLVPRRDWCPWKFRHVPLGFWDRAENRRRYFRWLGRQLGFRRPEDWYRVRFEDIAAHYGAGLLGKRRSLYGLMREFLPQLDWDQHVRHRRIGVKQVLQWADAYLAQHGKWPTCLSGPVTGANMTWIAVDRALQGGYHGLPGGSSLSQILLRNRGVRPWHGPPPLSEQQVLAWADAYFAAQGRWPTRDSGPIPGTRETWSRVVGALYAGSRGFSGGSSLADLLARRRGVRNSGSLPRFTEREIVAWARAHCQATGRWPNGHTGRIAQSPGDTWSAVDQALARGYRGLPGDSSLAKLLARRCGVKNRRTRPRPRLAIRVILKWAGRHRQLTGRWPTNKSGRIHGTVDETWNAIQSALRNGYRGLPGGSSLSRLLAERRRKRGPVRLRASKSRAARR